MKVHHLWLGLTACGKQYRNMKVTNDPEKTTCFRCRQIMRLVSEPPKPISDTFKAEKRKRFIPFEKRNKPGSESQGKEKA